jgi:hypothetical protein
VSMCQTKEVSRNKTRDGVSLQSVGVVEVAVMVVVMFGGKPGTAGVRKLGCNT